MSRRLISRSPTGVEHYVHTHGDELVTEEFTSTEVEQEVVEHVRTVGTPPPSPAGFQYAGSIPIGIYQAWRKEWKAAPHETWQKFLVKRLNSAEYRYLRAGGKRL